MTTGSFRIGPGAPYPLGATADGSGANFALFSDNAERVELCLFDTAGERETARIELPEYTDEVWHGHVSGVAPGQLYGYRAYGPYAPERGHRFNHHKLLIDPYARMLVGPFRWHDAVFGHVAGDPRGDLSFDQRDSAPFVPKSCLVDRAFDWTNERAPHRRWPDTVIYEMHVRGFTMLHQGVDQRLRGTFAGLAHGTVVHYLRDLGVTAVELLPVHAAIDELALVKRGLRNYWGYNSIAFFAPEPRYLADQRLAEVKQCVRSFHEAGLEVILDVVFNHTAESDQLGPTLSFRGIDNASYYQLESQDRRRYRNFTGTGNSLNLHHPRVMQMVMDALRYWVADFHVDGFRFDLATELSRGEGGAFDPLSGFLQAVGEDPVLAGVKLIAEPWDIGDGGYRLGGFPPRWAEWNDRYRDVIRCFWRGEGGLIGEVAARLTGSSDIFRKQGRRPWASVNYIASHDGFTLDDIVSYREKHNALNGEDNRDGTSQNFSDNYGVEGPTADGAIAKVRQGQKRNLLATLFVSLGVPMLMEGDEFGRTKRGNNNSFPQDNEINWVDWLLLESGDGAELHDFVRKLVRLRRTHVVFRRPYFFDGRPVAGQGAKDIMWLRPDGREMAQADWQDPAARFLSYRLSGAAGAIDRPPSDRPVPDRDFLVILNANEETVSCSLPRGPASASWSLVIDTAHPADDGAGPFEPGSVVPVEGRSFVLLQTSAPPAAEPPR